MNELCTRASTFFGEYYIEKKVEATTDIDQSIYKIKALVEMIINEILVSISVRWN